MKYTDVYKVKFRRNPYAKKALLDYIIAFVPYTDIIDNGNSYTFPLHYLCNKSSDFLNHFTHFLRLVRAVDELDTEKQNITIKLNYGYIKKNPFIC